MFGNRSLCSHNIKHVQFFVYRWSETPAMVQWRPSSFSHEGRRAVHRRWNGCASWRVSMATVCTATQWWYLVAQLWRLTFERNFRSHSSSWRWWIVSRTQRITVHFFSLVQQHSHCGVCPETVTAAVKVRPVLSALQCSAAVTTTPLHYNK